MTRNSQHDMENLERFVVRAEKLATSTFWEWMHQKRGASDMQKIIAGDWLAHDGFNQDSFEAFCLSLRFFIQKRDGYCLHDVATIAESWPDQHTDLKREVQEALNTLDHRLSEPGFARIHEEKETTNKELFDIVFYGGIVHENKEKRGKYDEITKAGAFSYFLFQAFIAVLFHYKNCILRMGVYVEKYLIREGVIPKA